MVSDVERYNNTHLLLKAVMNNDVDEVKRLIPISDPKASYSVALIEAAQNGHVECVKLLIPVSDPKEMNSMALFGAALNGHVECVKLLIPVSDVDAAVRCVKEQGEKLIYDIQAELQQRSLDESIAENYANAKDGDKRRM